MLSTASAQVRANSPISTAPEYNISIYLIDNINSFGAIGDYSRPMVNR